MTLKKQEAENRANDDQRQKQAKMKMILRLGKFPQTPHHQSLG